MFNDIIDFAGAAVAGGLWAGQSALKGRPLPLPPMVTYAEKRYEHVSRTVEYAPGLKLDIWGPSDPRSHGNRPVLFFIPGGAWAIGRRRPQGYALMSRLVEAGWVCVAIDYRVAPYHRWPKPFSDVTAAYKWVRDHIAPYGGNPDFVCIAGASAGAHMAALAGLTWAPNTRVPDAVVGLYGSYDWETRSSVFRRGFMRYLETVVVGRSQADDPLLYRWSSPMANVHAAAPPFMLVHGTKDRLCSVGEARRFYESLHATSSSLVHYCEIDGAGHAFDLFDARQTTKAVNEICDFLHGVYFNYAMATAS